MKLTTTLFLFAMSFIAYSQTTIKGTVLDEFGPLSGANIKIKNSKAGMVSNADGYYEIQANKGETLMVSYLGYTTEEFVVSNQKHMKIILKGRITLDEVEVIAYGSTPCNHVLKCYTIYKTGCGVKGINVTYNDFKSDFITEKLYPNPSKNGIFQLSLLQPYKTIEIQVNGISGQLIKRFSFQNVNKQVGIDLSQYPAGIYIINIIADGKRLSTKKAIRGSCKSI